ncbi:MAG: hypothetical protein JNK29_10795 [Anaerolineales bacterium]|nr:hypothetical protein [Anaerolineales bacterium]
MAKPDDDWRENFAISDLPAGRYRLKVTLGLQAPPPFLLPSPTPGLVEGVAAVPEAVFPPEQLGEVEVIEALVDVIAGQTNFVILQAGAGQLAEPLPAESRTPPYPTNTFTATATPTQTFTPTPTNTPRPSRTPTITRTPRPSLTPTITRTPRPTVTPTVTRTPAP